MKEPKEKKQSPEARISKLYKKLCKVSNIPPNAGSSDEMLEVIETIIDGQIQTFSTLAADLWESNNKIQEVLEVVHHYARFNFKAKVSIDGRDSHIDALAVGINMLGEELQQSAVSLSEKEMLLNEIHHRVKNNLQLVCSLLNIQSSYIKDPESLEKFKESQNRVNSMSLIHEMLYRSRNFSRIDFADYMSNIVNYLTIVYNIEENRIQLETTIESDAGFLPLETALPCGLILNELVTNSLKYAFPDNRKGKISFELSKEEYRKNRTYKMVFSDNGIGLPKGINISKAPSLGMQLIHSLVEQLDADLKISGENGACFEIRFTLPEDNHR